MNNILNTIRQTKIVKINNLVNKKNVNIYAKIEGSNPGGSIKDRIALKMIEEAEKTGELTKEKIIIEATSGNTGIALAMVVNEDGPVRHSSPERRRIVFHHEWSSCDHEWSFFAMSGRCHSTKY